MDKEIYLLFTAGRGPEECCLAVQGVQNNFKKYLKSKKIDFEIVSQKKGDINNSMETIVFKIITKEHTILDPWIGTIKWICNSPIRKFHKRKNWYIKCQEIIMPKELEFNLANVEIQSFRASGPGGQHRNKVETAIRITHKPSGIMVIATDGKSQAQNKKKAWKKLEDKIRNKSASNLKLYNFEQWTSQIEIERGNPIKTFRGLKFTV